MTRSLLGYQPALDGLRAAAVLMVLVAHTSSNINGGWVGVEVFFVLSGFLITTLLIEEHRVSGTIGMRGFYERRARRLLPALVACIVFAGLLVAFDERTRDAAVTYGWASLGGLLFVNNWLGATGVTTDSSLSHTWSLAQEEQFYLVWPLVLWLLLRRGVRLGSLVVLTLALSALAALWRPAAWQLFGPSDRIDFGADTRALGLVLGCALALACAHDTWRRRIATVTAPLVVPILAIAVIGYSWLLTSLSHHDTVIGGITLVDIASAALLAHVMLNRSLALRLFDSRPAIWIGQRSYGIYLYHFPIIALMIDDRSSAFFGRETIQMLFVLAATLSVAALSYTYIEQPFRTRGPKSARVRLTRTPPRTPVPVHAETRRRH